MKPWEKAWKAFEASGSVADYLAYCAIISNQPQDDHIEGDNGYADLDRRNRYPYQGFGQ